MLLLLHDVQVISAYKWCGQTSKITTFVKLSYSFHMPFEAQLFPHSLHSTHVSSSSVSSFSCQRLYILPTVLLFSRRQNFAIGYMFCL